MYRFYIILHPVCPFYIIFLYAFSALSSNVTFLYFPFIFLFCLVLPCTVSVLSSNVKFMYYSPLYPFCIILPCFLSALSCRMPRLYYVPIYRFLIILPRTLYHVLTSYIFRLCIIFRLTVCLYIFRCTLGPLPMVKQLNMLSTPISSRTEVKNVWIYASTSLYAFVACTETSLLFYVTFAHATCSAYRRPGPMAPADLFVSQRTGSHSAGISCTTHELFCP